GRRAGRRGRTAARQAPLAKRQVAAMSHAARPRQNRKPLRALLLALPAFMLVAAFTLITLSPTLWPPAEEADYPRWLPTASALVIALAGGAIGVYALRQVYLRTQGDFE